MEKSINLQKNLSLLNSYQKKALDQYVSSDNLKSILLGIINSKGKHVRSKLVLMSASATGEVNNNTFLAATLIDFLHNATLLHDDVIDNETIRRNKPTVNAQFGNKVSILSGDFLLSLGLSLSAKNNQLPLLQLISDTLIKITDGELKQLKSGDIAFNKSDYLEVIYKKTASLFEASCKAGAMSTGSTNEVIEKIGLFGKYLGLAFQIKDDIIDYSREDLHGKSKLQDVKGRKKTLPLFAAIENCNDPKQIDLINQIFRAVRVPNSKEIKFVCDFILKYNGIQKAITTAQEYVDKAIISIQSISNNEKLDGLQLLAKSLRFENYLDREQVA